MRDSCDSKEEGMRILCHEEGKCFAKPDGKRCVLLTEAIPNCPFKKDKASVTDGVEYPKNKNYTPKKP